LVCFSCPRLTAAVAVFALSSFGVVSSPRLAATAAVVSPSSLLSRCRWRFVAYLLHFSGFIFFKDDGGDEDGRDN